MRSDIDLELAIHKNEIDQLSRSVDSVIQHLNDLEENSGHQMSAGISQSNSPNDDLCLTFIATNVQETDEPILDVARDIVSHLDDITTVVVASRLRGRYGKPGLVKISFSSLEGKKNVLYKKRREVQNRFHTIQQISNRKANRTQCANYVERTSPRKPT